MVPEPLSLIFVFLSEFLLMSGFYPVFWPLRVSDLICLLHMLTCDCSSEGVGDVTVVFWGLFHSTHNILSCCCFPWLTCFMSGCYYKLEIVLLVVHNARVIALIKFPFVPQLQKGSITSIISSLLYFDFSFFKQQIQSSHVKPRVQSKSRHSKLLTV